MLQQRWVVFGVQFVVVAVIWGLFLGLVARRPLDGWFAVQVIGVGLAVALAALWARSRRKT
jgi:RsiW-degrading membrane proteinase PrsW (M82 family)